MAFNKKRIKILLLVLLLSCIAALALYLFNIRDFLGTRKVDNLIAEADASEERAPKTINRLMDVMTTDVVNNPRSAKRKYLEAGAEALEVERELKSAVTSMQDIQSLKVPVWQKNYADLRIQSLASRIKALDNLKLWFSKMELVADFLQRTTAAQQKFDYGLEKINEAIENANNKDYNKAKTNATKGKQLFDESQTLLQEADKMEKSVELSSVLAIVAKAQDFASLTIQLAEAGAAGKIDQYNNIAQECEETKKEVLSEWNPEAIKEPEKWFSKKTSKLEKLIDNHILEASELKENATSLYEKNSR